MLKHLRVSGDVFCWRRFYLSYLLYFILQSFPHLPYIPTLQSSSALEVFISKRPGIASALPALSPQFHPNHSDGTSAATCRADQSPITVGHSFPPPPSISGLRAHTLLTCHSLVTNLSVAISIAFLTLLTSLASPRLQGATITPFVLQMPAMIRSRSQKILYRGK